MPAWVDDRSSCSKVKFSSFHLTKVETFKLCWSGLTLLACEEGLAQIAGQGARLLVQGCFAVDGGSG